MLIPIDIFVNRCMDTGSGNITRYVAVFICDLCVFHYTTVAPLSTLSDRRKESRLSMFGKAVAGRVSISVDKFSKPTKFTRFSDADVLK